MDRPTIHGALVRRNEHMTCTLYNEHWWRCKLTRKPTKQQLRTRIATTIKNKPIAVLRSTVAGEQLAVDSISNKVKVIKINHRQQQQQQQKQQRRHQLQQYQHPSSSSIKLCPSMRSSTNSQTTQHINIDDVAHAQWGQRHWIWNCWSV